MACTADQPWLITWSRDTGGSQGSLGGHMWGADATAVEAGATANATGSGCSAPTGFTFVQGMATWHQVCSGEGYAHVAVQDTCYPSSPAEGGGGGGEPGTVQMLPPEFLNLTAAEGFQLGMAILAVWISAYAIRSLIHTLGGYRGDD